MNKVLLVIEFVLRRGICCVGVFLLAIGGYAMLDSCLIIHKTESYTEDKAFAEVVEDERIIG